ncbi:hypothetical protein AGMMS49942_16720 [Spirochaetia bacterium]|nr:hypothetical protein AGMMS49942_16720 [Spirochaetia bacterium]
MPFHHDKGPVRSGRCRRFRSIPQAETQDDDRAIPFRIFAQPPAFPDRVTGGMDVDTPEPQGRVSGGGAFNAEIRFPKPIIRRVQKKVCQTGVLGFNKAEIGIPNTIQVQE